jgi:hypothetical protein
MAGFPDEDSLSLLAELEVRYVLVDAREYGDYAGVASHIAAGGLVFAGSFEAVSVFLVP